MALDCYMGQYGTIKFVQIFVCLQSRSRYSADELEGI